MKRHRAVAIAIVVGVLVATVVAVLVGSNRDKTSSRTTPKPAPSTPETALPANGTIHSIPGSDVAFPLLPTGPTLQVPRSVAGDCSVDVTSPLQTWIDGAQDNATLAFAPNACYRIDGTLRVDNRERLRIEGNGATLRAVARGNRTRSQLRFRASRDITVQDLVVRGANPHAGTDPGSYVPELEAQHAFDLQGVNRVLLAGVRAYDLYGDFVYIGGRGTEPSRNVTISHSDFARSGRQGVSVTAGVGVAVADNTISGAARSMFDLEANARSASIRHILFLRNVTGGARNFWLANKGRDANIGDIQFIDNRMSAATGGLVFVFGAGAARGPYLFQGNQLIAGDTVSDDGSKGAFFFTNASNVTIRDNSVSFASGMTAIELRNTHHVDVAANHFSGQGELLLPTAGSSDYHIS